MVEKLRAAGFSDLVATPHQRAALFLPSAAEIGGALAEVTGKTDPALVRGAAAENFWDDVFAERLLAGTVPSYPGGRAFLFEVEPMAMPPALEETLFRQRIKGVLPVMAHPERYAAVQADPSRAEALGRVAALLVDVAALDGAHGRAAMKTARTLVSEGLAHAVASDVHRPADVDAVVAGMSWIEKKLGAAAVTRLLADNPRHILAGELP